MLLPAPDTAEEEVDARTELVHELLEYLQFKEAAEQMTLLREESSRRILRPNEQELYLNLFSEENPLSGKTLSDLQNSFIKVLQRADKQMTEVLHIEREQVTLRDRLDCLYHLLQQQPQGFSFDAAFADCHSCTALVVTFLALLELIRQHVARVSQSAIFGEILIYAGDLTKYDRNASI